LCFGAENRVAGGVEHVASVIEARPGMPLQMCTKSDAYADEDSAKVTRSVLEILSKRGVKNVHLCSRGGNLAIRDVDIFAINDTWWFGQSMSHCWTCNDFNMWEPHSPPPSCRRRALREAKAKGVNTFLVVAPVLDVGQSLELIQFVGPYCDEIIVGAAEPCGRYADEIKKRNAEIDWQEFSKACKEKAVKAGAKLHVSVYGTLIKVAGGGNAQIAEDVQAPHDGVQRCTRNG